MSAAVELIEQGKMDMRILVAFTAVLTLGASAAVQADAETQRLIDLSNAHARCASYALVADMGPPTGHILAPNETRTRHLRAGYAALARTMRGWDARSGILGDEHVDAAFLFGQKVGGFDQEAQGMLKSVAQDKYEAAHCGLLLPK
jgi:hypothetical protein